MLVPDLGRLLAGLDLTDYVQVRGALEAFRRPRLRRRFCRRLWVRGRPVRSFAQLAEIDDAERRFEAVRGTPYS
jgi:hypothetical protein